MHQVLHCSGCAGKIAVPMVVRDIGNKQVKESLYLPVNVLRIKRRVFLAWKLVDFSVRILDFSPMAEM